MPNRKSTQRTKPLEEMKVALVHYTASGVGGVEGVIAMHRALLAAAVREVRVVARRGAADVLLKAKQPAGELRTALHGCDAVFVHNVLTMPFDLPLAEALWQLAAETPEVRWVGWVHDLAACNPDYDRAWHQPPWQRLAQASPHFTYVAVSEHRARQFEALTGAKARVIPNGIDVCAILGLGEPAWAFAKEHALLARDIVLIHPARLVRRKRIELSLEAAAELRRRGRDAVALITAAADPHNPAGAAYAGDLRARADALGLGDAAIFLHDGTARRSIPIAQLYAMSDALIFPSREEGFGLPVLEAALQRLPVFCTDVEPLHSLLDRGIHVFAPDASAAEIATLIERTLDRSPAWRARREVLRRYSWETILREHLAPLLA